MNYGKILPIDILVDFLPFPQADIILRRYIDLPKLLYMLMNQSLYFSSLGVLEDKFEGTYSLGNIQALIKQSLGHIERERVPEDKYREIENHWYEFAQRTKDFTSKHYFVNCWNSNPCESYQMWRSYSDLAFGVCVQTTFGKMKSSYQDNKNLRCHHVGYLDEDQINTISGNILPLAFSKTKFYQSEDEVRLLLTDYEEERDAAKGISLKFNMSELIEAIILPPRAPNWYESVVIDLAKNYGIGHVRKSSIEI